MLAIAMAIGVMAGLITGGVLMATDGYKKQIAGAITCIASIVITLVIVAIATIA